MAVSKSFKDTIKNYLDDYSKKSPEFAVKYTNEKKSIDECCNFICREVQKKNVTGMTDDEVYYLARHYYDEEDLGEITEANCKITTNQQVQLTEEEIAKAKEQAIEEIKAKAKQDEIDRIAKAKEKEKAKAEKFKKQKEDVGQISLFDL